MFKHQKKHERILQNVGTGYLGRGEKEASVFPLNVSVWFAWGTDSILLL